MKLNLGCGGNKRDGYINIDYYVTDVDLVHDLRTPLPYQDNSVDEIYASHVIEHFRRSEWQTIKKDWCRVLKSGGKLTVGCPNFEQCLKNYLSNLDGRRDVYWIETIYGTQSRAGEFHKNGFTKEQLIKELTEAGFTDFVFNEQEDYNLEVSCIKQPKILVACPNHECKEYSFQLWIDHVKALNFPNYEILVVDNSPTLDFMHRWEDQVPMIHIDVGDAGPNQRIAQSLEYLRTYFLAHDFEYWFNVESDVIIEPETLNIMLKHGRGFDWVGHSYPDRTNVKEMTSGIGCCLWSRKIMQENDFIDAPERETTDGWWWHNKIKYNSSYKVMFELWNLFPIQHLNEDYLGGVSE